MVIDASVLIDALATDGPAGRAARKATMSDPVWLAPAHLIAEVASGVRGLLLGGKITRTRADEAIETLTALEIELTDMRPLLPRVWELRPNLTAYDAAYIALAEASACPLVTGDERMANAPGIRCEVQVLG